MNKTKQKIHVTKLFQFWGLLFILGIGISITVVDIIDSYREFTFHSDKMRSDFISRNKHTVRQEVMRAVALISHEKAQSESRTKKLIKARTYEAAAIARNIYQQNKTVKSKAEITKMILDALRPIRYERENGYYFMTDLNGTAILFADRPEREGENLLNMQDPSGQSVIQDMMKIVKQRGEGFYQYHRTKPGRKDKTFKKISFIKYIEPLNCFIGTGLYVDVIQETIEAELLATISRIRFGQEGYLFVYGFNGDTLVGAGKHYSAPQKLWERFSQQAERMKDLFAKAHAVALTPDGDFIYYTFPKLTSPDIESPKTSFIYGIPDLQWLIGAGIYLDDVETDIALMQAELTERTKRKILYFFLITLGILTIALLLFRRINQRLNKDINTFINLSNQLLSSDEPIDRHLIKTYEFDQMAKNINSLFMEKRLAQHKLTLEKTALLQSETKYRSTMDSTFCGICIIQDLTFQYVNPAMATMFGYTPDEMLDLPSLFVLIIPEQQEIVKERLFQRSAGKAGSFYDYKFIRKSGEVFDAMVVSAGIIHEGKPASLATIIDISDRKAAEEALKKNAERATALLEAIPDMVFRLNRQGDYVDFKAGHAALFIRPENGSIIGHNNYDLLPQDVALLIEKNLIDTLTSGKMHSFEYQLFVADHGLLDYEARMVKSGEDEVTYIVRNITKRKQAAKEKEALEQQLNRAKRMESLGLMASGVAHDLNNILSGLVGYPELILHTLAKDSPLRPQIVAIRESGERAAAVVDDLLTVARGAASTRAVHDIDSLVLEYLNSLECAKFKSLYPQVSIKCQRNATHVNISCSLVHIKKCIMNLVTNGIEAITGSGTVTVSTRNHFQDASDSTKQGLNNGEHLVLSVHDDGPGIAQEDLGHIFEPFYSKKIMEKSGTGLGLTVVWNTVQEHNGMVFVDSDGEGTNFQLYFPVSHEKNENKHDGGVKNVFTGNGERILVADDEELLRNVATQMLELLGYTVDTVASGEAAIEFIRKNTVDLLLMDMLMPPGINGYQAYKEIIKIHPGQKAVILSGFSKNKDVKATLQLGAGDFIKKPYTLEQLGRVVSKMLRS